MCLLCKLLKPCSRTIQVHGGGYVLGSKYDPNDLYNPATLIADGLLTNPNEGLIFVSLNYRLGALGWLAGPTLQSDGTANAGFHDQRMALEWVRDNIHLFGGDSQRVTMIGESAGGGSVIGQLAAFGGVKPPFAQAIAQSPAALPVLGNIKPEKDFQQFLRLLNVTSLAEARTLPSEAIIAANAQQISASPYGSYTYGPVQDGDFMREASLDSELSLGMFDPSVKVIVGHNINEGGFFADPSIKTEAAFSQFVSNTIEGIGPEALDYILQVLYPPVFDGSYGYTDYFTRSSAFSAESIFDCHAFLLSEAYQNTSYACRSTQYPFALPRL
jgi:carboxylesterase type B